jgi:hypothetical protein
MARNCPLSNKAIISSSRVTSSWLAGCDSDRASADTAFSLCDCNCPSRYWRAAWMLSAKVPDKMIKMATLTVSNRRFNNDMQTSPSSLYPCSLRQ